MNLLCHHLRECRQRTARSNRPALTPASFSRASIMRLVDDPGEEKAMLLPRASSAI